jgi:hypothetical protein
MLLSLEAPAALISEQLAAEQRVVQLAEAETQEQRGPCSKKVAAAVLLVILLGR